MGRLIKNRLSRMTGSKTFFSSSDVFQFTTNWNTGVDGNFTASVTTSSGIVTWILPDGTRVTGNSINTSNGSLNGSNQTIKVTNPNIITGLNLSTCKLQGTLNLSKINLSAALQLDFNSGLTGFQFSNSNTTTNFSVRVCGLSGVLDLSTVVLNGAFSIFNNSVTNVTYAPGSVTTTHQLSANPMAGDHDTTNVTITGTFSITNSPDLDTISHKLTGNAPTNYSVVTTGVEVINLGNIGMDTISLFDIRAGGFSTPQIEQLFDDLDSNTTSAIGNTIDARSNALPTGGLLYPAIVSLISKGVTVLL